MRFCYVKRGPEVACQCSFVAITFLVFVLAGFFVINQCRMIFEYVEVCLLIKMAKQFKL